MQDPNASVPDFEPGPERLRVCASLLRRRHFTASRDYALRVSRSDPAISHSVDQILAIAEVLIAAQFRFKNDHHDWYAVLQLSREDARNRQLLRNQFKKLLLLVNPNKNSYAFAKDAFMLVHEAWSVLSDPEKRTRYEREMENQQEPPRERSKGKPGNGQNVNGSDLNVTFWTMCPYCWVLYEYEKKYEECSLRCQNCRKAFHGARVDPPAPEMVVQGEEKYYCYNVQLPVRYPVEMYGQQQKRNQGEQSKNEKFPIHVSDDDVENSSKNAGIGQKERVIQADDGIAKKVPTEGLHEELGNNGGEWVHVDAKNKECEKVVKGSEGIDLQINGERKMRVKTVAKSRMRIPGNRKRSWANYSSDREAGVSDLDVGSEKESNGNGNVKGGAERINVCDAGKLGLTEEDRGIFVGVRYT